MNSGLVKLRVMKVSRVVILSAMFVSASLSAAEARIVKVLPHFLDAKGRHTLHPSLFERDGYQAHLRAHRELCSGMRFDVQWKGRKLENGVLKLEVLGANSPPRQIDSFTAPLKSGGLFSRWSGLKVAGEDFKRLRRIIAWRISLWDGDQQLTDEKSFLWQLHAD